MFLQYETKPYAYSYICHLQPAVYPSTSFSWLDLSA